MHHVCYFIEINGSFQLFVNVEGEGKTACKQLLFYFGCNLLHHSTTYPSTVGKTGIKCVRATSIFHKGMLWLHVKTSNEVSGTNKEYTDGYTVRNHKVQSAETIISKGAESVGGLWHFTEQR